MALGTITKQTGSSEQLGQPGSPAYAIALSFAGDDSYPTGGTADFTSLVRASDAVSPKAVSVLAVIPCDCGATYIPYYDAVNDKLMVRATANGAEVSNATNLSGTTFRVVVLCV